MWQNLLRLAEFNRLKLKIFCYIYGIKFEDVMLPFYFHFEITFDGAWSFAMQNKFIGDHEP